MKTLLLLPSLPCILSLPNNNRHNNNSINRLNTTKSSYNSNQTLLSPRSNFISKRPSKYPPRHPLFPILPPTLLLPPPPRPVITNNKINHSINIILLLILLRLTSDPRTTTVNPVPPILLQSNPHPHLAFPSLLPTPLTCPNTAAVAEVPGLEAAVVAAVSVSFLPFTPRLPLPDLCLLRVRRHFYLRWHLRQPPFLPHRGITTGED